jgi:peroxiredoxin
MVSVDTPANADQTFRTFEIPFPVLSDSDLVMHRAFKVLNVLSDEMVAKFKGFGIDFEKRSGRRHHTIAIPALFVVDRAGIVRWAHADRDHKTRPSIEQVLGVLAKLKL